MLALAFLVCCGFKAPQQPTYEFNAAELIRVAGGEREVIGCTDPDGPGTIHGVARSSLGTTYVIADNGLYSLSDDINHLTPLPRRPGAPTGIPRGLQIDERGVIWLATDDGFGSVEPVHLFGHVIAEGAFTGLTRDADGTLHAQSSGGAFDYRPGTAAPPVLELEHADAAPIDGVMHVRLRAVTRGPALFGYRSSRRPRYLTQASGAFEIPRLDPGHQELMFCAYDQDMRRSADLRVAVEVPYPKGFSKAVAVPAILAVALGLLLAFLAAARRGGGGRVRYTKAVLSTFVSSVVALQILAGVIPHARGWPFVGFTMYAGSYAAGAHTYKAVMEGVRDGAPRQQITPGAAGYISDGNWQALLPLIYGDDADRQRFVDAFNERNARSPITGFVILDEKHRLTAEGPIKVAPVVMCVYPMGALDAR